MRSGLIQRSDECERNMPYRVLVDDNFHYMDEDQRYELGAFASLEAAIAAAKAVVDNYFEAARKPGITAHELFESYTMFGEDPLFLGPTSVARRSQRGTMQSAAATTCVAPGEILPTMANKPGGCR
jgi:hypothetical protein